MGRRLLFRWLVLFPLILRGLSWLFDRLLPATGAGRRWVCRVWPRLPHFVQNLIVGVLIAAAVHLGHGLSLVRETEDLAMDWMNRMQVDTRWMNPAHGIGYTLLDMDEATFAAWSEPFHVPRDRLAELIRYAADGDAAVIVVDVALNRPGPDPAADAALARLIAGYPDAAPDLILLRTPQPDRPDANGPITWRETYFDASNLSGAVHFAHARFAKDARDRRLRRWRLVERGCLAGRPETLPAVQLLVDVLLRGGRAEWDRQQAKLDAHGPPDCASLRRHRAETAELTYGAGEDRTSVRVGHHGPDQRVVYSYSDRPRGGAPARLIRLSAEQVPRRPDARPSDPVSGRVVVIGASYADSRDLHETPVGRMPGALILLNAIKSLQELGQLHRPPPEIVLLIEGLLIVAMAWFFSRLDSAAATLAVGTVIAVALVPIGFAWFRYGVWVDLAAPVVAMQLHQVYATVAESRQRGSAGTEARKASSND